MLRFHTLFTIVLGVHSLGFAASDIDAIQLVQTVNVDISTGGLKTQLGALRDFGANALSWDQIGIKAAIAENLGKDDLGRRYFTDPKEREKIAAEIESQIKQDQGGFSTSGKMIRATDQAFSSTVKKVIERVFKVDGVKDASRAALWSDKILASFHACTGRAGNAGEARKCVKKASVDLPTNVALATVHSISKETMSDATATKTVGYFKKCLGFRGVNAGDCGMVAARQGAVDFIHEKYLVRQKEQLPNETADLSVKHMPNVRVCISGASKADQFIKCADEMAVNAGQDIARIKALANEGVQQNVSTNDQQGVSDAAAGAYTSCVNGNLAANRRDPDGSVTVSNCEGPVRLAIAQKVTESVFGENMTKTLKKDEAIKVGVSEQEFTEKQSDLAKSHNACLVEKAGVANADTELLGCFEKSGRAVAQYIGSNQFKAALAKHMTSSTQEQRDDLQRKVMAGYEACLAQGKSRAEFENCGLASARALSYEMGSSELNHRLASVIGTKGLAENQTKIEQAKSAYRDCLARISDFNKIDKEAEICGADLTKNGMNIVKTKAMAALRDPSDTRQTTQLKTDLVNGLDSLTTMLPSSGGAGAVTANGNIDSMMGQLKDMIKYDQSTANKALGQVAKEISRPGATKESIGAAVMTSGSIDQMIKSMAYQKINSKLSKLKGNQLPSPKTLEILKSKANLDRVFDKEKMTYLRNRVMRDLMVAGSKGASPEQLDAAMSSIERDVKKILVDSEHFGRLYARDRIQAGINKETPEIAAFFGLTPNFSELRQTRGGRQAENRFLDLFLRPMIVEDKELDKNEIASATKQLTRYVKAAVDGRYINDGTQGERQIAGRRDTGVQ